MTKRKQMPRGELSKADLRSVQGGLMPYGARFKLEVREALWAKKSRVTRRRELAM